MTKNHYNDKRVQKHVSVDKEREKHILDWFNQNKGQASVLIKQWIEREIESEKTTNES